MAKKKLQVKNLQVSFRTQGGLLKAVRNISFDLMEGETLAIVGESGSGKSVTSKAIIGILSGNSIVEGGEILYDGKDLLKIDEENFHKIRGDKIAMIFQDPLSSLNPIMRVGQQLTEAMILNGKARQKNSRAEFNSHLKLLQEHIAALGGEDGQKASMCDTFNAFCVESIQLEKSYDDAENALIALKTNLEELIFLIEKDQKVEMRRLCKGLEKSLKEAVHPYVIRDEAKAQESIEALKEVVSEKDKEKILGKLHPILELAEEAMKVEHPDFFRLGYYKMVHPEFDPLSVPSIAELDEMTLKELDSSFMLEFMGLAAKGLIHAREVYNARKQEILPALRSFLELVQDETKLADKKAVYQAFKPLKKEVKEAIDQLAVVRPSVEYSFDISLAHELERYYEGLKSNPKNLAKYERSKAKWDKLNAEGKTPTWQVIPPYLVDLELTRSNITKIVADLIRHYEKRITTTKFIPEKEAVALVDFLKEQASRFVHRVTQDVAKARALELLKEVGIPQPHIRYKQYPFEFSGGMRQRIVIAIALSANPDILICDEPTTALDVTIQAQILELINKIKEERHLSVIFITHDLGVVANMADRIAVMYAGKIVEYGSAEDIFYDPKHPYTWALLASMPDLETNEKLESIPGTPPNMIYPPKGDAFAERNKYALAIDFEEEPPFFEVSEGHYAATWLLHPSAPKVEPPKIIQERITRMKKEATDYGK